jgi:hypothetical protein
MRRLRHLSRAAAAFAMLLAASPAFANATVIILNGDAPGVGMNDATPVAPVGGNAGTTLGQQRLNAVQHAANLWGQTLDSPVPIRILVTFEALACNATGAVLASAGTTAVFSDFAGVGAFPGSLLPATWYSSALADKLAGEELEPTLVNDIRTRFNINLGQPTCFAGSPFYYGLDANEGAGVDIVATALHEFGHGLGFQQFASLANGALFFGQADMYNSHLFDTTQNLYWPQMTDAQRLASSTNSRRLVWDGPQVNADASAVLSPGTPILTVTAPAAIAGIYAVGTASFGPPLTAGGLVGEIVQAIDAANAAGPSATDACTAITNAAAIAGRIALVDRGTCGFVVKAANLQAAGAAAMIVADNVAGGPPPSLGGVDPAITIPAVRITLADGNTIKAQLAGGVTGSLGLDLTLLSGADLSGRVYINAPNPVVGGSSISHWDPLAFRNLLMEPNINNDLTHSMDVPADLTLSLFRDIGWFADADNDGFADGPDECDSSSLGATVIVAGSNTGIPNVRFTNGCTMNDYVIAAADGADNHGGYVSALSHLGNAWRDAGLITAAQRAAIQKIAAQSSEGKY